MQWDDSRKGRLDSPVAGIWLWESSVDLFSLSWPKFGMGGVKCSPELYLFRTCRETVETQGRLDS